jgi:hypothetical protein
MCNSIFLKYVAASMEFLPKCNEEAIDYVLIYVFSPQTSTYIFWIFAKRYMALKTTWTLVQFVSPKDFYASHVIKKILCKSCFLGSRNICEYWRCQRFSHGFSFGSSFDKWNYRIFEWTSISNRCFEHWLFSRENIWPYPFPGLFILTV